MTEPRKPPKSAQPTKYNGTFQYTGDPTKPIPKPAPAPSTASVSEVEGGKPVGGDSSKPSLKKSWDENAIVNSILRGDHFEPNLANKYYNLAYHWRFFAMPDEDFFFNGGDANEGGTPDDIKEFYQRLDKFKQVIIAETGVTGYNITAVELTSVFASDMGSRNATTTNITLKISEPNGVAFLDALTLAAKEAGLTNYLDYFYYLELTFMGYDQDGEIVLNPFDELPNGGRWLWTVKIKDIDVALNSGGGIYTLNLIDMSGSVLTGEYVSTPDTLVVQGETVGELFDEIGKSLTTAWSERLVSGKNQTFIEHKFQFHGIPARQGQAAVVAQQKQDRTNLNKGPINAITGNEPNELETSDNLTKRNEELDSNTKDLNKSVILQEGVTADQIRNMKIRPKSEDFNSIRNVVDFAIVDPSGKPVNADDEAAPKGYPDSPTAAIPRGTSIPSILDEVMSCTEDAQDLAKDSSADQNSADDSDTDVNNKGFRESVTWQIVPEVRFDKTGESKYDYYTNRYGRTIIWHIYACIDQEPILSTQQISSAFDKEKGPRIQKESLAALAARGFLPKRYDYLFTGLNTEVLNFDINFNFAWGVTLPRFTGYYNQQNIAHVRLNPAVVADQIQADYDKARGELEKNVIAYNRTSQDDRRNSFGQSQRKRLEDDKKELRRLGIERDQRIADARIGRRSAEEDARVNRGNQPPIEQNSEREYIETVMRLYDKTSTDAFSNSVTPLFPISFSGGDQARQEAGYGGNGQWHNGRQLFGEVLNQRFGQVTNKFQTVEMNIRGDPFWLGYGSYEKTIQHIKDNVEGKNLSTTFYGQNCFIFRFKYPTGRDEGGNIMLTDNETVTGVYKVTGLKSSFTGGMFTQTLTANRQPLIDLFTTIYGVNSDDTDESDQPTPNT